jgi:hypothetical protein
MSLQCAQFAGRLNTYPRLPAGVADPDHDGDQLGIDRGSGVVPARGGAGVGAEVLVEDVGQAPRVGSGPGRRGVTPSRQTDQLLQIGCAAGKPGASLYSPPRSSSRRYTPERIPPSSSRRSSSEATSSASPVKRGALR